MDISPQERGYRAALMRWATGAGDPAPRSDRSAAVVLADAAQLDAVVDSGWAGTRSVVFVPQRQPGVHPADVGGDRPRVVGYTGSFAETDGEVLLPGDFYLQQQSYGLSQYMSAVGPTVVRVAGAEDFEAYLADADRARETGQFADFTTNPVIALADLPGLGAGPAADGTRHRLWVDRDGQLSTSPAGRPFGLLGQSPAQVQTAWVAASEASTQPCGVCLAQSVREPDRSAQLSARPWLSRYLVVLAAVRDLRARGAVTPRVSGFGGRLACGPDEPEAADLTDPAAPVLLTTGHDVFLHAPTAGRTLRVDPATARCVELLLACGSVGGAAEHLDPDVVRQVADALRDRGFGWRATDLVSSGGGIDG